ncbi:MAG: ferredoxin family protein [Syntrophobacteraceae bacterium]|nr:ferredoxin family protein [Desulfobacteraceae bacterium]
MALKRLSTEQLLGLDKFLVDDDHAHIAAKREVCRSCQGKPCVNACPAGLYTLKEGELSFDHAGCLECGTCRVVCPQSGKALEWSYPRGGFGVQFRYG